MPDPSEIGGMIGGGATEAPLVDEGAHAPSTNTNVAQDKAVPAPAYPLSGLIQIAGTFAAFTFLEEMIKHLGVIGDILRWLGLAPSKTYKPGAVATYKAGDTPTTKMTQGLRGSMRATHLMPAYVAATTEHVLHDLWTRALPARIKSETASHLATAQAALHHALHALQRIVVVAGEIKAWVRKYVHHAITALHTEVRKEIKAAVASAESYAAQAVAALKTAEDKAIANAVAIGHAAQSTADKAKAEAEHILSVDLPALKATVEGDLRTAIAGVETDIQKARAFATAQAQAALQKAETDIAAAKTYAFDQAHAALTTAEADIAAVKTYAGAQAAAALDTATQRIGTALQIAESYTDTATAQAEAQASAALQAAQAKFNTALSAVDAVAVEAEQGVQEIAGKIGTVGTADLVATIPALATLVTAIAVEAGLSTAQCRANVGDICEAPPGAWAGLMGLLALFPLVMGLEELVNVVRPIAGTTASVVGDVLR